MPDLNTLVSNMMADGSFARIGNNPLAQFGRSNRRYLGAEVMPERTVTENAYREDSIRYRTTVAGDGTRYSPAQKRGSQISGSMMVELGNSDIASELDGRLYDALIRHLGRNASMEAIASVTNWADTVLNLALIEYNEKQRWQAIVDAQVVRVGDNNYSENVNYPNPTGHRVTPAAAWSTDTTDIFADIHAQVDLLASKGYTVSRMITGRDVLAIMAGNNTVKTRVGVAVVNNVGQITSAVGRASQEAINQALQADGLPPIETYDLQYRTPSSTAHFLKRGSLVMLATTGQEEEIDTGDEITFMENTIGYTAVGRATGQPAPGRVIRAEAFSNKPPRIEGEAWQASLPVITDPEAIAVIKGIS